ncbi:MAG TPA: BadF/BadG/BcrA/BcrD ATPase family protein [Acidimicrobiales bacterium]
MKRPALLALDGGGSKIDAALVTVTGQVLGAARWRGARSDGLRSDLGQAVDAVCADAGVDPRVVPVADLGVYCLAGADLPPDYRRLERMLTKQGWSSTTDLRNDTFAVLRTGTERAWGVAVVCGTGMNCAAVSPEGRVFRFPAVGYLSGDWGGGHDIGLAALWHAVRAEDGRGERSALARLVPAHFGLGRPRRLTTELHFGRLAESRLDELAPVVFGAAADGDAVAGSIVERQADEIVTMAGTALRRLGLADVDGVEVVLGGGVFLNDHAAFFDRISQGILGIAPGARMVVVTDPPVVGAALLGLDILGASRRAATRVRGALTHGRLLGRAAAATETVS